MAQIWFFTALTLVLSRTLFCEAFAGCKLDIGFILDGSGSIGRHGLSQEIAFVEKIASAVQVSATNSHVSAMVFESSARMVTYFKSTEGQSTQHFANQLKRVQYRGGGTNTEAALNLARTSMFASSSGSRTGVNKVLIVFTDGRSSSGLSRVRTAAQKLKDLGINLISIGIGRYLSTSELYAMASAPTSSHVFRVSTTNVLSQILNTVKSQVCKAVNCWYAICEYNSWSPWSNTCGQASRQRTLKTHRSGFKVMYGGCAGTIRVCVQTRETKDLGKCQACKLDIGFVLDESGSIGSYGFTQELNFVKSIAKQLSVSGSTTHVSVMTFSYSALMRNYFKDASGQSQSNLERLLNSVRYRGGGTQTVAALDLARTRMFTAGSGARSGISKILIVFTDGRSARGVQKVTTAAQNLKNTGVNIISIGVGSSISTAELHAMASNPTASHVFRVSSASLLNTIVQKVKSESCKTVQCVYAECTYGAWGAWSRTCGDATRQRSQLKIVMKSKQATGGCAGLSKTCDQRQESKNLGVCLVNCRYAECNWGPWGAWSATCGFARRQRNIVTSLKYTKRVNCHGLTQTCRSNTNHNVRNTPCTCKYVQCSWGSWGAWSATCGFSRRSRKLVAQSKTISRSSCHGLTQSCNSNTIKWDNRITACTCNYVACSWGSWSSWSTSCGYGRRSRKLVGHQRTTPRTSCHGLRQTCHMNPHYQSRSNINCKCDYVQCIIASWSSWSRTCGNAKRTRSVSSIKKIAYRQICAGLTTSCSSIKTSETRQTMCTCNYVQCNAASWSAWSTSCGNGKRTRTVSTVRKSVSRVDCSGLTTSCASIKTSETRQTMCTCNYVQCNAASWSAWSTSCGNGKRTRTVSTVRKSVSRVDCSGLTTSCASIKTSESRQTKCTCNYVQCNAGSWSAWSTSCGNGKRTRNVSTVRKSVSRIDCTGLTTSCASIKTSETRQTMCTCNYVQCNAGSWSAWSTSCGNGKRTRTVSTLRRSVSRVDCSGLTTSCASIKTSETRQTKCTCNYVQCNAGPWSAWSTSCGDGKRTRTVSTLRRSVSRVDCSGLTTNCASIKTSESRQTKCTCNYVQCNAASWSAWSTSCGDGKRTRTVSTVKKSVSRVDCSGLTTSCASIKTSESRQTKCTCNYVQCNAGSWSAWSTSCGNGKRTRTVSTVRKSVSRVDCSGLTTSCASIKTSESRQTKCTCQYVECNYGPWSLWTATCGKATRARKMIETSKTAQRTSCDGLPTTCSTVPELQKRVTNCSCNTVECSYGPWSSWSTSCGSGRRTRKLEPTKKTVSRESCDGLPKSCSTTPDVETRHEICKCKTVKCEPTEWTQWSTTCGDGKRTRGLIQTDHIIERNSCDGLPTKCSTDKETQLRNVKCEKPDKGSAPTCHVKLQAIGCYKDDMKSPRPLPELIMTERDRTHAAWNGKLIDWENWDTYMYKLICRCAEKAKSKKYSFIGLQFFGECWSGPEAGGTYNRNGLRDPGRCFKQGYAKCKVGDKYCIGSQETNFVYQIMN